MGLYRADGQAQLDGLLGVLPLADWMQITVTPLEPHANDPTSTRAGVFQLPNPRLTPVYRLDATLGEPLDVGDVVHGHRRIVPLTGGTFTGAEIAGKLVAGPAPTGRRSCLTAPRSAISATRCRQMTGICSTSNLVVCATAPPRSSPVWAVGRTSTPANTPSAPPRRSRRAAPALDWLNKGGFVSVAGRQAGRVIYETYLVG